MLLATFAFLGVAVADERRIGVASNEPRLREAIGESFAGTGLRAIELPAPPASADAASAVADARRLASEQRLVALAWTRPRQGAQAPTLWLYDAIADQLTIRALAAIPLDDAAAAAAALSVKTALRDTLGGSTQAGFIAPARPPAAPLPVRAAPSPAAVAAAPASTPARAASPSLPPMASVLAELSFGARLLTGAGKPEAWGGISASVWPAAFDGLLGARLGARAGAGIDVDQSGFVGQYAHREIFALGLWRLSLANWSEIELGAGAAAQIFSVLGAVAGSRESADVSRVDASLDLHASLGVLVGARLRASVAADAGYLLTQQRYLVDSAQVLAQPPLSLDAGLVLSLATN